MDQLLREAWDDSKVQEVRQVDKILHTFHASFSGKAHVRLVLLALSVMIWQALMITSANTLQRVTANSVLNAQTSMSSQTAVESTIRMEE